MRLKNEAIKKIHQGVTLRKLSDSVEFTEVISINRPSRLTINSNARGSLIRERTNKYLRFVLFIFVLKMYISTYLTKKINVK